MKSEPINSSSECDESDSCGEDRKNQGNKLKKVSKMKRKYEDIPTDNPTKNKKQKNDLYRPPTVEELNNLKVTENLFNNNLFRLQIEELLTELKIKVKRKNHFQNWLQEVSNYIQLLPSLKIPLSELSKLNKANISGKNLLHSFILLGKICETDQDVTLKFEKPEKVQYFGLYEHGALPGPNITLNINLVMPKTCFLVKDYLNNRYLMKKMYYLLYVAEFLKQADFIGDLKLEFYENNCLQPTINIKPVNCDKINLKIHVTPSEDSFNLTRFLPDMNNIKLDLFDLNVDSDILRNTNTVLYNSLLAHDATLFVNNEYIKELLNDQTNIKDGIKLLSVWLNQRELNVGLGAFTETIMLYLVIYLLEKKKINKYMSSYQIIRNFWTFITTKDLLAETIHIGEVSSEILAKFKQHFSVVILDKTGCYNVASFLSEQTYEKVKFESQVALRYLDGNKTNSFHELFLTKYPFHLQYDAVIDLTKGIPLTEKLQIDPKEKCLCIGYENILILRYLTNILKKALNTRVLNIVPKIETSGRDFKRFLFGLSLNPEEAFNFIDMGPPLNKFAEAEAYRNFWGELASDRRFKDGSTNVAVYFRSNTISAKRKIITKIVDFVLQNKLNMEYKMHYNEFEDVLHFKQLVPNYPNGTNEETCLKIILASDNLSKILRELPLSLKITGIQGVSDVFAYADVFPPIPTNFKVEEDVTKVQGNNLILYPDMKSTNLPYYVQPIECVLQLEHSSKWPNDLQALRHLKASFHIEISRLLGEQNVLTHPTRDYLVVFYEGIVFRYRFCLPKEIGLVKKTAIENGLTGFKESPESFQMEVYLNILPKIVGALRGIQSMYPSYGPGTALIKRWLRTHLIDDDLLPDMVINLLNASLYLNNNISNTPQISFMRFLKFVSEFDWNLQIVVVNFNDELTNEEISKIESNVQSNRNAFPNLFILTPYDQNSSVFTKNSPSKEILNRLKRLATESTNFINEIILNRKEIDFKGLFLPNFEGYDVLIHLKSSINTRNYQRLNFSTVENRIVLEKYKISKKDKIPVVDFDPVGIYLDILRKNYGNYAIFFHDSYGGDVICVLWLPKTRATAEFKVSKINAQKIVDDKVVFNFDAAIEDFFILGKGLVDNIEKR
ncbi:nucleolar protein 6 [Diorhabda carinulata]|uniref:nucleolar protein 6 n=1 Tax=Diorhabda carinulata TaxID=1163345 RepID=UPI0025A1A978|nr:nucleolar protein 6 [Diorhabda carinulata]